MSYNHCQKYTYCGKIKSGRKKTLLPTQRIGRKCVVALRNKVHLLCWEPLSTNICTTLCICHLCS